MRIIALACSSLVLVTSAVVGAVDDEFATGVRGVPWGTTFDELIAIRPGGDQYFSTAPGERCYIVADDEALYGIARPGMRMQYPFSKYNRVISLGIGVPYDRREQLLSELLLAFGPSRKPYVYGSAIHYDWPATQHAQIGVRASRDPKNGMLELWIRDVQSRR
jgi:hypothetical protein